MPARECTIERAANGFILRWRSPADGDMLTELYTSHGSLSRRLELVLGQPVMHVGEASPRNQCVESAGINPRVERHGSDAPELGVASLESD
jgi:hypothetical protein